MDNSNGEQRPRIDTISNGAELKRWYWLKDELVARSKICGVKCTGGKFVILERLAHFLDTGETIWPGDVQVKIRSRFDWHKEPLDLKTLITDSYKSTQNVRRFFQKHASPTFKFNIAFMDWIKSNPGKTLADAVDEFHRQQQVSSAPGYKTDIKPHNQFNQYTRDILADNPGMTMNDVRRIWEIKRGLPTKSGRHIYERSDLILVIK